MLCNDTIPYATLPEDCEWWGRGFGEGGHQNGGGDKHRERGISRFVFRRISKRHQPTTKDVKR